MRVLLELRPALDGHAGIPQANRLLFRGLMRQDGLQVHGLLQSSNRLLAPGLPAQPADAAHWAHDRCMNRLARVVVSVQPEDASRLGRAMRTVRLALATAMATARSLIGRSQPLGRFNAAQFEDFIWRALFARTLSPEDFAAVTGAAFRVARLPWSAAHAAGLLTRRLGTSVYPRLDTRGYDVMIAETPYPGRVRAPTRLVVRYHDAIPLLMPHTIVDRARHQASHYEALRRNVRDGAWFACVSEASRRDLVSVFPQAEPRAVTIPNMVSPRFFVQPAAPERVPDILRTRANRHVAAQARALSRLDATLPANAGRRGLPDYLLMVSTLEPRKNHLTLQAAWERLRAGRWPKLQLVLVGMLGWDHGMIVDKLLPWVARQQVHVLDDVPAGELRLLYQHARMTVCPSFGEGFGYSGVEAMRCGGVVLASDLPVHREVYADGAEYFNPYSVSDLAASLQSLLDPESGSMRDALIARGDAVAARYLPERILPQWRTLLEQVAPAGKDAWTLNTT